MELTQAIDVLKRSASAKQEEVNALNLAVSVLEGTFAPELKVLESIRTELAQKDTIISEKVAVIESISAEKNTLEAKVQELSPVNEEVIPEEAKPSDVVPVQEASI